MSDPWTPRESWHIVDPYVTFVGSTAAEPSTQLTTYTALRGALRPMNETEVREFWNAHPCGDHIVGGLHGEFGNDYERFFAAYDAWRYDQEGHIPACLDRFDFRDKRVLEIGLGQGAESEQLIRRGARWSGLDITPESVERVRARLELRELPHDKLRQGSALDIPWSDDSFDVVFSHGVLHHICLLYTSDAADE